MFVEHPIFVYWLLTGLNGKRCLEPELYAEEIVMISNAHPFVGKESVYHY